jgi:hypothetical protein
MQCAGSGERGAGRKFDGTRGPVLSLFAIAVIAGCGPAAHGPPAPATFTVTGEVRHADGQPVPKGLVQFFPESGAPRNISAPIKDGKFNLITAFGNETLSGATEGRYRVTVISGFNSHGAPVESKLADVYEIKPKDNHFVFTLPKGI